ncbi:MAG TPA: SDR family NAD(P)-dependent oxidoreductase [Thermoanaerobaculia bacterium]|nr:SDR family NAD(P)-dependent oxidoreductase [Thermoanaerobaculia bacterium]
MKGLADRTALVTGGSRGLGAEVVRHLARHGADVAFTYQRSQDAAAALRDEIESTGRRCAAIAADVASFATAECVVDQVLRDFESLHFLVCNAGFARSRPLAKMTEDDWDSVVDVCLKGAFNYIRAAAPHLVSQTFGRVVCIGSINGLRGRIGTASYNAAKAGLVGLVKTAAAELGQHSINVNLVAPGFIETPSQSETPEIVRDLVLKECAIKRLGRPEDVAPVVAFLCSDDAHHLTGQVLKVDAGQYL